MTHPRIIGWIKTVLRWITARIASFRGKFARIASKKRTYDEVGSLTTTQNQEAAEKYTAADKGAFLEQLGFKERPVYKILAKPNQNSNEQRSDVIIEITRKLKRGTVLTGLDGTKYTITRVKRTKKTVLAPPPSNFFGRQSWIYSLDYMRIS